MNFNDYNPRPTAQLSVSCETTQKWPAHAFSSYVLTKYMVLTRAAANNRTATVTVPVESEKRTREAVRAAKKTKEAERAARLDVIKKSCVAAQKKRDEASAAIYIGMMKYLGAIQNIDHKTLYWYTANQ
jgi:hypothetical protein